jgi:hypothetical protein
VQETLPVQADHAGLARHLSASASAEVTGNVSFTVTIPADEPLLIKPVGMCGNAWEVNHFIGSRLFGHPLTALLAGFSMHSFSSSVTYMKYDAASVKTSMPFSNFGNGDACQVHEPILEQAVPVFPYSAGLY